MLTHSVYFYLKEGVSDHERAEFRKSIEGLQKIETVHEFYLGTPAATPDRPVIEKGYAYGMTILFRTVEDHNRYQVHTIHEEFVQVNGPLFEKVVIYDAD